MLMDFLANKTGLDPFSVITLVELFSPILIHNDPVKIYKGIDFIIHNN